MCERRDAGGSRYASKRRKAKRKKRERGVQKEQGQHEGQTDRGRKGQECASAWMAGCGTRAAARIFRSCPGEGDLVAISSLEKFCHEGYARLC